MCDKDPESLIIEFVENPQLLMEEKEAEMRSKVLERENNIKKRLHTVFSILNERGSFKKNEGRGYEDDFIEDEE